MAQKVMTELHITPTDFYSSSLSDWLKAQNAKSRDDRIQDPLNLLKQARAIND